MFDAISANSSSLINLNPEMIAIYLTGSSDIRWLPANVAQFPKVTTWVRIDQGGPTTPQYEANVVDVESGAWTLAAALSQFIPNCTAPRPTIYCSRDTYAQIPASYTGAIWLAAPGLTATEAKALAATDKRIVAVQNVWNVNYDSSVVIDPAWPLKPVDPPTPPPGANTSVQFEYYKTGFGWVFVPNSTIIVPESGAIRARASNGAWSNWTEIVPGTK